MLLLLHQSSKSVANSSSCLSIMEVIFTQSDRICFPPFFLLCGFICKILLLSSHGFVPFSYFLKNIFIVEHKFPMFGHGFRTVSHWTPQVWKVLPSSMDFPKSPPFWCVFQTWIEIFHNLVTQNNFFQFPECDNGLLTSCQAVPSAWKVFPTAHFSLTNLTNSYSRLQCWFLC